MQAHLVGRNISRLRVSPLVSFPILLPHFLSKREMTLRGDSQFNKQNAERERWQISRPRCIALLEKLKSCSSFRLTVGEWINEFIGLSLGRRNTLYGELLLRKTLLAAEDSPSINSLTYFLGRRRSVGDFPSPFFAVCNNEATLPRSCLWALTW